MDPFCSAVVGLNSFPLSLYPHHRFQFVLSVEIVFAFCVRLSYHVKVSEVCVLGITTSSLLWVGLSRVGKPRGGYVPAVQSRVQVPSFFACPSVSLVAVVGPDCFVFFGWPCIGSTHLPSGALLPVISCGICIVDHCRQV